MYLLEEGRKLEMDDAQKRRKLRMVNAARNSRGGERYVRVLEEEEKLYLMDLFGGLPENYFPNTAKALSDTCCMAQERGVEAVIGDTSSYGFVDAVFLKRVSEDGDNIRFEGGAVVVDYVRQLTLTIDVYELPEPWNGEVSRMLVYGEPHFSFAAGRSVSAETEVPKSLLANKDCGVILTAAWVTEDGTIKSKTSVEDLGDVVSHPISRIELQDPEWKRSDPPVEGAPVILCYNRTPSGQDSYDYLLTYRRDSFYIPSKGFAVFEDKSMAFDHVETTLAQGSASCLMFIRRDGGGATYFQNEPGKDFADFFEPYKDMQTGKPGFCWDFKNVRWTNNNPLPSSQILLADYKLTVDFYVKNSSRRYSMVIYSDGVLPESGQKVRALQVYWGCLCRDTRISMADGSVCRIQEIKTGQKVKTPEGNLVVKSLVTGKELRAIYKLTTCRGEEKKELYLTGEHPLVTDQGICAVEELTPCAGEGTAACRENVASEDGGFEEICAFELVAVNDSTVYNLVLECEDGTLPDPQKAAFYAEGLLVGDNNLQAWAMQLRMEAQKRAHGLPRCWEKDVESARTFFKIHEEGSILWKA